MNRTGDVVRTDDVATRAQLVELFSLDEETVEEQNRQLSGRIPTHDGEWRCDGVDVWRFWIFASLLEEA